MPEAIPHWIRFLWQADLLLLIQQSFGPIWRYPFEVFALLGGSQITIVAVAWVRWFRGRDLAARLLLALFLGIAVDLLIWNLWPTPRPDDPRLRIASVIPISSFPSGHLVTVLTLWGTLAAAGVLPRWVVVVIAFLVGLSRLGLGAHYPGDVLGGIVVGALVLALALWLYPRLKTIIARWPWPWPLVAGASAACLALAASPLAPPGRWSLLGLLAGVLIALSLDARLDPDTPGLSGIGRVHWQQWGKRLAVATLGLVPLALVGYLGREVPIVAGLLVPTLIALWILLGAPLAFRRLAT